MNPILIPIVFTIVFMITAAVGYMAAVITILLITIFATPPKVVETKELNTHTIDKLLEEMEDELRRHGMPKGIFDVLELYVSDESDIKNVTCTDPDNDQWMIELWGSKKEVVFIEKQGDYYASDIYSKKNVTNRNIFDMMESHYSKDEVVDMMKHDPMGTILLALECRFENEN